MRITVHLDSFDRIDPSAYAIVWLDKSAGKWSREGHAGVPLPAWGRFDVAHGDTTLLNDDADQHPLCVLEGLDFGTESGPFEGEEGTASWQADAHATPVAGRWHVQWVDDTKSVPEYGLFADDHV